MKKSLIAVLLLACVTSSVFVVTMYLRMPKTAYVELGKVYNEFEMKKELEAKLKTVSTSRQNILDSLQAELEQMARQIKLDEKGSPGEMEKFQVLRDEYYAKQQQYTEDNESTTNAYTEQIWEQLNQYVKDYGDAQGYNYILGADGSGAVMYANKGDDITVDLTEYVNERYKGNGK